MPTIELATRSTPTTPTPSGRSTPRWKPWSQPAPASCTRSGPAPPEARNALSKDVRDGLWEGTRRFVADDSADVLVLTGAGDYGRAHTQAAPAA